jgi:hypothetical protein
VNDLPPPTDDELLLAFVDDCPSMAAQDYQRRTRIDWLLTPHIRDHFEREWEKRMNSK